MEIVNFVDEDGREELKVIYTPFIYANVIECSNHFVIYEKPKSKNKVKVKSVLKKKGK